MSPFDILIQLVYDIIIMDLRQARLTKYPAITQNRLEKLTGISQSLISAFENGDKIPTDNQKMLINDTLEARIDWE